PVTVGSIAQNDIFCPFAFQMSKDRRMGNSGHLFPATSWELLDRVRRGDARSALDEFAKRYYEPAYRYLRRISRGKIRDDRIPDLIQDFFTDKVLSGYLFKRIDRGQGSFRTYLKAAL